MSKLTVRQAELLRKLVDAGGEMQARPLSASERSNLSRMQWRGLVKWKATKHNGKNLDDWIASITEAGKAALATSHIGVTRAEAVEISAKVKNMSEKTLVETVLENRKRPVADDFRPVAKPVFDENGNMDAFEAFMKGATKRQVEEHGRRHLQKDKP